MSLASAVVYSGHSTMPSTRTIFLSFPASVIHFSTPSPSHRHTSSTRLNTQLRHPRRSSLRPRSRHFRRQPSGYNLHLDRQPRSRHLRHHQAHGFRWQHRLQLSSEHPARSFAVVLQRQRHVRCRRCRCHRCCHFGFWSGLKCSFRCRQRFNVGQQCCQLRFG